MKPKAALSIDQKIDKPRASLPACLHLSQVSYPNKSTSCLSKKIDKPIAEKNGKDKLAISKIKRGCISTDSANNREFLKTTQQLK